MKKLYIIFICALCSMGLDLYLSHRSYSLSAGKAKDSSICHISARINCDRVLTSDYSELLGMPLSHWGFATHFIIAGLSLGLLLSLGGGASWFVLGVFAVISAMASLLMWGLSYFVLSSFCPLCVILYLLSFIILVCVFYRWPFFVGLKGVGGLLALLKKGGLQKLGTSSQKNLNGPPNYILCLRWFISVLGVFVVALVLVQSVFTSLYDIKSLEKTVKFNVMDWRAAPVRDLKWLNKEHKGQALLTMGVERDKSSLTVIEFADFLCHFCRDTYYSLKASKNLPGLRVEYFSFPLDQCKGPGISCLLTRAVYCAEQQKKGWALHDLIFDHQPTFIALKNNQQKAWDKLKNFSQQLKLDQEQWELCVPSALALDFQQAQVRAGKKMGVLGTPTVFVNGKKLSPMYLTKTLQVILSSKKF